jgi:hypothetical protein
VFTTGLGGLFGVKSDLLNTESPGAVDSGDRHRHEFASHPRPSSPPLYAPLDGTRVTNTGDTY